MKILLCTLATLVLLICHVGNTQQLQTTPSPGTILTGEQLRALLAGKTMSSVNEYQKPYSLRFNADGRVDGTAVSNDDSGATVRDGGQWRIVDNTMCVKMGLWVSGRELCWHVAYGAGVYRRDGGRIITVAQ